MREILFRGKLINGKRKGQWAFGDLLRAKGFFKRYKINGSNYYCEVETGTIGQWTGVIDREGRYIYEGDIIKCYSAFDDDVIREVAFSNGSFIARNGTTGKYFPLYDSRAENLEILGNKWDNPELLEVQK